MKNNKKQGRCPFSPLTLLAALLLIGGMLAVVLPVLQWDAEVSAEAGEYEQLREQKQQAEVHETAGEGYGGLVRISGAESGFYCVAADSGDECGLSRRADG